MILFHLLVALPDLLHDLLRLWSGPLPFLRRSWSLGDDRCRRLLHLIPGGSWSARDVHGRLWLCPLHLIPGGPWSARDIHGRLWLCPLHFVPEWPWSVRDIHRRLWLRPFHFVGGSWSARDVHGRLWLCPLHLIPGGPWSARDIHGRLWLRPLHFVPGWPWSVRDIHGWLWLCPLHLIPGGPWSARDIHGRLCINGVISLRGVSIPPARRHEISRVPIRETGARFPWNSSRNSIRRVDAWLGGAAWSGAGWRGSMCFSYDSGPKQGHYSIPY